MFMRKPYALETYKKNLKKTGAGNVGPDGILKYVPKTP